MRGDPEAEGARRELKAALVIWKAERTPEARQRVREAIQFFRRHHVQVRSIACYIADDLETFRNFATAGAVGSH